MTEAVVLQSSPKTDLELDVEHFLIALRQAGCSSETIEKYKWQLDRLLVWLAERDVVRLDDLSRLLLREWGAGLYDLKCKVGPKARSKKPKGWEPATIRHAIFIVRSFLNWCWEEELIAENLAGALKPPKDKKRLQRTLNIDEIQELIKICDLHTLKGLRDAALVSLLTDSGLRSCEVRRLAIENVQFGVRLGKYLVNMVEVIGKGGDEKSAFFGQATAERIQNWLEVRPTEADVDELFVSIGGSTPRQPFTRHGLRITLTKLGNKAGVKGVTPHAFRRSFACIADEAGASTRKIQSWGGWSDIKMVERYTRAMQAGKQYNRYSPMDYIESLDE